MFSKQQLTNNLSLSNSDPVPVVDYHPSFPEDDDDIHLSVDENDVEPLLPASLKLLLPLVTPVFPRTKKLILWSESSDLPTLPPSDRSTWMNSATKIAEVMFEHQFTDLLSILSCPINSTEYSTSVKYASPTIKPFKVVFSETSLDHPLLVADASISPIPQCPILRNRVCCESFTHTKHIPPHPPHPPHYSLLPRVQLFNNSPKKIKYDLCIPLQTFRVYSETPLLKSILKPSKPVTLISDVTTHRPFLTEAVDNPHTPTNTILSKRRITLLDTSDDQVNAQYTTSRRPCSCHNPGIDYHCEYHECLSISCHHPGVIQFCRDTKGVLPVVPKTHSSKRQINLQSGLNGPCSMDDVIRFKYYRCKKSLLYEVRDRKLSGMSILERTELKDKTLGKYFIPPIKISRKTDLAGNEVFLKGHLTYHKLLLARSLQHRSTLCS